LEEYKCTYRLEIADIDPKDCQDKVLHFIMKVIEIYFLIEHTCRLLKYSSLKFAPEMMSSSSIMYTLWTGKRNPQVVAPLPRV